MSKRQWQRQTWYYACNQTNSAFGYRVYIKGTKERNRHAAGAIRGEQISMISPSGSVATHTVSKEYLDEVDLHEEIPADVLPAMTLLVLSG